MFVATEDRRQLELLSTFHYAYAVLLGLSAACMLMLVLAGVTEVTGPNLSDSGDAGLIGPTAWWWPQ